MEKAAENAASRTRTSRFMEPFPVEFFDMARPRFVHLRMHSEYSVSDGIVRIDEAAERAAADGMPALALTDSANLFGMVKFYGAARRACQWRGAARALDRPREPARPAGRGDAPGAISRCGGFQCARGARVHRARGAAR